MIFATCILVRDDNVGLVGSVLILHHLFVAKELTFMLCRQRTHFYAAINHSLLTILVKQSPSGDLPCLALKPLWFVQVHQTN